MGKLDFYQVSGEGSITSLVAQEFPVGRELFPVAVSLDNDLVAGVGQPVQGDVAEDEVVEETQPLVHAPVVGDDEAGDPMATDDQLVEVSRLQSGEPVETQIGRNEQTSLYRPVGAATLRGSRGIGVAMRDQRSLSRPGPSSPWPASTASPGRCGAARRPPPSSGGTAPPAPGSRRAGVPATSRQPGPGPGPA